MNVNVTELENQFGQYLQAMTTEPLIIEEKSGTPMAVMMSYTDYERLMEIEEAFWAANALKAEKSGYVGDNSLNELRDILALKENENTL